MRTKRIAVCVAYSTPVDRRQRYVHLNGFYARWLILFQTRTNMHSWIRYQCSSESVLPCLSVTLSNIIGYLSYFIQPILYYRYCRPTMWWSSNKYTDIKSRNMIQAQISIASRWLQNILRICVHSITFRRPHFYLLHLCSLSYICVTSLTHCDIWLQIKPNL